MRNSTWSLIGWGLLFLIGMGMSFYGFSKTDYSLMNLSDKIKNTALIGGIICYGIIRSWEAAKEKEVTGLAP